MIKKHIQMPITKSELEKLVKSKKEVLLDVVIELTVKEETTNKKEVGESLNQSSQIHVTKRGETNPTSEELREAIAKIESLSDVQLKKINKPGSSLILGTYTKCKLTRCHEVLKKLNRIRKPVKQPRRLSTDSTVDDQEILTPEAKRIRNMVDDSKNSAHSSTPKLKKCPCLQDHAACSHCNHVNIQ